MYLQVILLVTMLVTLKQIIPEQEVLHIRMIIPEQGIQPILQTIRELETLIIPMITQGCLQLTLLVIQLVYRLLFVVAHIPMTFRETSWVTM